jgi:hypothetical protein
MAHGLRAGGTGCAEGQQSNVPQRDSYNLVPLCEAHHHLVHEGGWTLELHPDRRTIWGTPDGTVHHNGTTIDRRPQRPANCQRPQRHDAPTTAAEIAADLERALAAVADRAPP